MYHKQEAPLPQTNHETKKVIKRCQIVIL